MTADYAALEARVAELEQQMRHWLPARIDAVAYGLSLVHEDLRAFRGEMGERLGRVELRLDRQGEQLSARASSSTTTVSSSTASLPGWTGTASCCRRSSGACPQGLSLAAARVGTRAEPLLLPFRSQREG